MFLFHVEPAPFTPGSSGRDAMWRMGMSEEPPPCA